MKAGMKTARERLRLDPLRLKPGFQTYYSIGVEFSKLLPGRCTYEDLAKAFGLTKQNAYTACSVALGKLVYGIAVAVRRDGLRRLE